MIRRSKRSKRKLSNDRFKVYHSLIWERHSIHQMIETLDLLAGESKPGHAGTLESCRVISLADISLQREVLVTKVDELTHQLAELIEGNHDAN